MRKICKKSQLEMLFLGICIFSDPSIGRRAEIREFSTKSKNTRSGFLIRRIRNISGRKNIVVKIGLLCPFLSDVERKPRIGQIMRIWPCFACLEFTFLHRIGCNSYNNKHFYIISNVV